MNSSVPARPLRREHPRIRKVLALFALTIALVARVLLADVIRRTPEKALWPDSGGYLTLARAIAAGGPYRDPEGSAVDLMRPPGYPSFLAFLIILTGDSTLAPVILQMGLGLLISWLLFRLGAGLGSWAAGVAGALLYALTPNAMLWSVAILSDAVFTCLVVVSFVMLASFLMRGGLWRIGAAGLLVGTATLVRPVGIVLLPIWCAFVISRGFLRRLQFATISGAAGLFLVGALALTLPWAFRNAREYGIFSVSPIHTWNLGRYHAPYTLMRAESLTLEQARLQVPTSRVPQPGDRARYLSVLLEHPLDFLYVYARGTWYVLSEAGQPNVAQLVGDRYQSPGVGEALRRGALGEALERLMAALGDPQRRWFVIVPWTAIVFQAGVYLAAAWGTVRAVKSSGRPRTVAILAALTALAFLLIPGSVGTGRFRLPAEPFLSLLAGIGLAGVRPAEENSARAGQEAGHEGGPSGG
jgi:4-amino-4-deoxy-L-arabinose transferase-like glycosyltransferase